MVYGGPFFSQQSIARRLNVSAVHYLVNIKKSNLQLVIFCYVRSLYSVLQNYLLSAEKKCGILAFGPAGRSSRRCCSRR